MRVPRDTMTVVLQTAPRRQHVGCMTTPLAPPSKPLSNRQACQRAPGRDRASPQLYLCFRV